MRAHQGTVDPASTAADQAPKATGTGTRSRARRELVLNDLLEKATELFADKGYEATTLQDIADAVGVSRPALYHYVANKEDLLSALVEKISKGLADTLSLLRRREDLSPSAKLKALTEMLVRDRAEFPGQFRVLDRSEQILPEAIRADHLKAKREVLAELVGVIDEGIAAGAFKRLDSRIAALSVLGMCNWVAWWFQPGPEHDVEPVVNQISQAALDMLSAPADRSRVTSAGAALARARADLDVLEQFLPDA